MTDDRPVMRWEDDAHEVWSTWASSDGGLWAVQYQLAEIDGRMECAGVWIRSLGRARPGYEYDPDATPLPLYAHTLRELPFAGQLASARRGTARAMRLAAEHGLGAGWADEADAVEQRDGQKSGRHAKFGRAELERAAAVYSAAFRDGSTSPTRDVAEAFGISRSTAAKLIMRCRRPDVGLLAPTELRKAGGIAPEGEGGKP